MPGFRWLVVPPSSMCGVWAHRLLRFVPIPARESPRRRGRPYGNPELRARRGLVLGLRDQAVSRGSEAGAAAPSPDRAADAGSARPRAEGLAAAPALGSAGAVPVGGQLAHHARLSRQGVV